MSPPTYRRRAEDACSDLQKRAWADGYRAGLTAALADLSDGELATLLEAAGRERDRRPTTDPGPEPAFLDASAAWVLSVSSRAYRVLAERLPCALWGDTTDRAVTVRDLCACTELDLFKLRGCGVTTLDEIVAALAERGLALAGGPLWGRARRSAARGTR